MWRTISATVVLVALCLGFASAEEIGSVDSEFKLLGSNHKIAIEVFDDPGVEGVSCYVSRAKKGGIPGWFGVGEDTSDASVACRQIGEVIRIPKPIALNEVIFSEQRSLVFKHLHVARIVDPKRNVLTYLVYSDKLVDGSPKNSITAVPVPVSTKIPLK